MQQRVYTKTRDEYYSDVPDWCEAEIQHAAREDHRRYTPPTVKRTFTPISYWAFFDGEHGQAHRMADGSCWFVNDGGQRTLLSNADIPALTLLGKLEVVACTP